MMDTWTCPRCGSEIVKAPVKGSEAVWACVSCGTTYREAARTRPFVLLTGEPAPQDSQAAELLRRRPVTGDAQQAERERLEWLNANGERRQHTDDGAWSSWVLADGSIVERAEIRPVIVWGTAPAHRD